MVDYPYYSIGSFSLNDSNGRWNENEATETLPIFPGVGSTVTTLPGVPGEIPGPIAANMSSTLEVRIVVWAIASGVMSESRSVRIQHLMNNIETLYRGIQGAAAAYGGGTSVPLTRHSSLTDSRTAYGRFEASSKPVMDDTATYATATLLFNIPSGTWRKSAVNTAQLTINTDTLTAFASCTGPIPDSRVVLVGPMTSATVTNAAGVGFKLTLTLTAGQWTVVDTANWTYRAPSSGTVTPTATATLTGGMEAVGAALGSALVLVPSATTMPIDVSMTGSSGASRFMVRAQPAYF